MENCFLLHPPFFSDLAVTWTVQFFFIFILIGGQFSSDQMKLYIKCSAYVSGVCANYEYLVLLPKLMRW